MQVYFEKRADLSWRLKEIVLHLGFLLVVPLVTQQTAGSLQHATPTHIHVAMHKLLQITDSDLSVLELIEE